ncbi:MAG: site-specific integrase [SAR324 cluster bacterium]|nr:site-specific integrase [SAR324 cluster bacterium]
MATFKRGKWYWMDDVVNGVRYRQPLKTKNWQEALRKEKETLVAIAEGKAGSQGAVARQGFNAAADAYLGERVLFTSVSTCRTEQRRSQALRRFFGTTPLRRITAEGVVQYQAQRKAAGISGRTINFEVSLLRRILKRYKQWARLAEDVNTLPVQSRAARVMTPEEKARLLETAASKPRWQVHRCAAVLALNTAMRSCELKGLRWKDIDLFAKTLTIHRQTTKTDAGERVIPLNRDAVLAFAELRSRAEHLGSSEQEHYVFPACEMGRIQPGQPVKYWDTAWRTITKTAGLQGLRFHDLRHQAVTELAERGLTDGTIMSIAGHVSRKMLEHYSHIRLEAKRRALECLETPLVDQGRTVEQTDTQRLN